MTKEFRFADREPKKPGTQTPLGSQKHKSVKARTLQTERDAADTLGGVAQPASGAMEAHKGDIRLDDILLDSKETEGQVINVTKRDLVKICREAFEIGKHPGIVVKMNGVATTVPKTWVMLPITVIAYMLERGQGEGLSDVDSGWDEGT